MIGKAICWQSLYPRVSCTMYYIDNLYFTFSPKKKCIRPSTIPGFLCYYNNRCCWMLGTSLVSMYLFPSRVEMLSTVSGYVGCGLHSFIDSDCYSAFFWSIYCQNCLPNVSRSIYITRLLSWSFNWMSNLMIKCNLLSRIESKTW